MSNDPMAEIRASFFVECEELLESLQDALNVMDEGAHDSETINVVFRAVHSIKGGAGAFGLDGLVAFSHRFETVMDEVRSGRLDLTPEGIKLFFVAADILQDIVRATRDGDAEPAGTEEVLTALEALLGEDGLPTEEAVEFAPMGLSFDFGGDVDMADEPIVTDREPGWSVTFSPEAGLYASGNEALLILRSLPQLGVATIRCLIPDDLPPPTEENAETPLLTWEVTLRGDVTEGDIRQVFDFVADVCLIEIEQMGGDFDLASDPSSRMIAEEEEDEPAAVVPPVVAPAVAVAQAFDGPATPPAPPQAKPAAPAPAPRAANATNSQAAAANEPAATVRVDLEKIDRLVNLVGELVINQAMLAQSVEEAGIGNQSDVMSGLESFMMLTRDIQESVMMIRAQPVKPLFQRMARIVREASTCMVSNERLPEAWRMPTRLTAALAPFRAAATSAALVTSQRTGRT